MTFYNYETLFISVRDALRNYLHANHIHYELSSCESGYHFEIQLLPAQVPAVNSFLDSLWGPGMAAQI